MRISTDMLYKNMAKGLQDNLKDLNTISNRIATGKKINKPSEDVLGTLKAMDYKLSISQTNQALQNITEAVNYMNFDNTVLTQVSDTLASLKKLTSLSATSPEYRTYYASQAATLRDNLLDLSNSTYLNSYVFSGSQTDQQAYVFDGVNHLYAYQGDSLQNSVSIGTGVTTALNIVGNSTNGAVATPFNVSQAPPTTTLSDGSSAVFTVAAPANNSMVIQVQIFDSLNNQTDTFSFSNVMDVANLISHAWQNQDVAGAALSQQQSSNRIEALAGTMDNIQSQLLTVQGQMGIRQAQLNDQNTRLQADKVTQQNNLGQTEDANMDETIVALQQMTTSLNALRSAAAKILPQTLFDFLQ
jgi:flagellar hook-associated protein 3 FlgL